MAKVSFSKKSVLAQNIIRLRRRLGWNQEDLAYKSGVNVNSIKLIETDKNEGRKATRQAISEALGCKLDDLYQVSGRSAEPEIRQPAAPESTLSAAMSFGGVVLTKLSNLSPSHQHHILTSLFEDSPEILAELARHLRRAK